MVPGTAESFRRSAGKRRQSLPETLPCKYGLQRLLSRKRDTLLLTGVRMRRNVSGVENSKQKY